MPRKAMVMTVGTGKDVWHGLAYSIENANPDFVLFLVTRESMEKTLPLIKAELERQGIGLVEYTRNTAIPEDAIPYILVEDNNINNTEKLLENYRKYIERNVLGMGYRPGEISVDITSGTKAMSSALLFVALELELNEVRYVEGERGKDGRVTPGTERVVSQKPLRIFFEKRKGEVILYFNKFLFESALTLLGQMEEEFVNPERRREIEFLTHLVKGFKKWDLFDFTGAMDELKKANEMEDFLKKYRLKKKLEIALGTLKKEIDNPYSYYRVVDLFYNGKRRFMMGRYDDAVARFYRLLEYIAQCVLKNEHKMETGEIDLEKLKEKGIYEKWLEFRKNADLQRVGLQGAYYLLGLLGEPVDWINSEEVRRFLHQRNYSILAHGFVPIDKEKAGAFMEYLEREILPKVVENFKRLSKNFEFPQIEVRP